MIDIQNVHVQFNYSITAITGWRLHPMVQPFPPKIYWVPAQILYQQFWWSLQRWKIAAMYAMQWWFVGGGGKGSTGPINQGGSIQTHWTALSFVSDMFPGLLKILFWSHYWPRLSTWLWWLDLPRLSTVAAKWPATTTRTNWGLAHQNRLPKVFLGGKTSFSSSFGDGMGPK